MTLAHRLRRALWRAGIDVRRVREQGPARLLEVRGVDLVLDVGAHDGGYAQALRRGGYRGAIHSFEPLPDAYERLAAHARDDDAWSTRRVALGDRDGVATLHVAGNSGHSSSVREMLPRHRRAAPDATPTGLLEVELRRLDEVAVDAVAAADRPFAKLDVQGYEDAVLDGAAGILDRLLGVQVELSLVPLYDGCPPASELTARIEGIGMNVVGIEPGFADPETGELLQYDAIFMRA